MSAAGTEQITCTSALGSGPFTYWTCLGHSQCESNTDWKTQKGAKWSQEHYLGLHYRNPICVAIRFLIIFPPWRTESKRCSLTGIKCPKFWRIITWILLLWKWALIILMIPWWPTFGGLKKSKIMCWTPDILQNDNKHPSTNEHPTGQAPEISRNDDLSPSTSIWLFLWFLIGNVHICTRGRLYMLFMCVRLFVYAFHVH